MRIARPTVVWRTLFACAFCVAACASVARFRFSVANREIPDDAPSYAGLVSGLVGSRIGYTVIDPADLSPAERDRAIRMSWEVAPGEIVPISTNDVANWTGAVISPRCVPPTHGALFQRLGFETLAYNDDAVLRARTDSVVVPSETDTKSGSVGGLLGTAAALVILLAAWLVMRTGQRPSLAAFIFAFLVFVVLSVVSLGVGLTAPNGLAVYAGKARLFLLAHGIPEGFWRSSGFAVYQPSYPIAMMFPALAAFSVGGFDTCWLQLFVPCVLALLFLEISPRIRVVPLALSLGLTLGPCAQTLATGFYAEPLCALLLVMGWKAVSGGRPRRGWILVGLSGLVRQEGVLIAFALWLYDSIQCHRINVKDLLWAVLPGILWMILVGLLGARVQGFAFDGLDSGLVSKAGAAVLGEVVTPRSGGWLVVLSLLALLVEKRPFVCPLLLVVLLACVFAVAMGFAVTAHADWILETFTERYLWLSAILLACAALSPGPFRHFPPRFCYNTAI